MMEFGSDDEDAAGLRGICPPGKNKNGQLEKSRRVVRVVALSSRPEAEEALLAGQTAEADRPHNLIEIITA